MIDSHCHLYDHPEVEGILQALVDSPVERVLVVSEDIPTMEKALALRDRWGESVLVGLGLHPVEVLKMDRQDVDEGLRFIQEHLEEIHCIGEIGLDFKYARTPDEQNWQKAILREQLSLAREGKLPVNLHSRWAQRQTMEAGIQFHQETQLPVLLHWFTHSKKLIRQSNQAGLFVSVGPSVLYSPGTREVISTLDPSWVLLETDTPVPFQGKPASPLILPQIAQVLAELFKMPEETFMDRLRNNENRFLISRSLTKFNHRG